MKRHISIIVIFLLSFNFHHVTGSWELSKVMDKMFDNYDQRVRPFHKEKTLEVSMSAYILDVFGIDEMRHEFSVTMYLRHHWTDERLVYEEEDGVDRVLLDADHAKNLWIPDTFLMNQRSAMDSSSFPEATIVFPEGSILRSTRLTTTASCKMDLSYFPFDQQVCSVDFESYGHTASDFYYKWKGGSVNFVGVADEGTNSRFRISSVVAKDVITHLHGNNFSRFSVEFIFVRSSSRYIVDIFIPIAALTLVSLMTLWLEEKRTRVQVSCVILGTTSIFTAISLLNFPKVSYQTSLDAYIFFCSILSLIVVMTNFAMDTTHNKKTEKNNENDMTGSLGQLREDHFKIGRPTFVTKSQDFLHLGFSKLRFILPIMFISFNFAFWIAILIGSAHSSSYGDLLIHEEDFHDE